MQYQLKVRSKIQIYLLSLLKYEIIEQKGISSASQTSASKTGTKYLLLFNIPIFQRSLTHDLALNMSIFNRTKSISWQIHIMESKIRFIKAQ